ncbi:hypothetical protein CRUP_000274 [Coryphaenoides rupestris]|nr:hypothetical protein CRUP_000274 [Coryphaenoides rupestris]
MTHVVDERRARGQDGSLDAAASEQRLSKLTLQNQLLDTLGILGELAAAAERLLPRRGGGSGGSAPDSDLGERTAVGQRSELEVRGQSWRSEGRAGGQRSELEVKGVNWRSEMEVRHQSWRSELEVRGESWRSEVRAGGQRGDLEVREESWRSERRAGGQRGELEVRGRAAGDAQHGVRCWGHRAAKPAPLPLEPGGQSTAER